jgi:hypothetical protein
LCSELTSPAPSHHPAGKFERADALREKYAAELAELYKLDDPESATFLHGPQTAVTKEGLETGEVQHTWEQLATSYVSIDQRRAGCRPVQTVC